MASALALSGCSLLFEQALPGCQSELAGTVAHFRVDGDEGETSLTDWAGDTSGRLRIFDSASGASMPLDVVTTEGPRGCGEALQFDDVSTAYLEFPDLEGVDVVSVDFWFYLVDIGGLAVNKRALLGKDQVGDTLGDLSIFINQDDLENHGVFVRLQGEREDFLVCSEALEMDAWHHLALTLDGVRPRLYVDGVSANNPDLDISQSFGRGLDCLSQPESVLTTTLEDNLNDWLWGATNFAATPEQEKPENSYLGGAVDELRLRDVAFTEDEATQIFQASLQ